MKEIKISNKVFNLIESERLLLQVEKQKNINYSQLIDWLMRS